MRWLLLVLAACGRLGFDGTNGDGGTTGPDGKALGKIPIGTGGEARGLSVPGPTLQQFYVLYGHVRIVRTDDGGATFTDCGALPSFATEFDAAPSGRVAVATATGVFESVDGCATFVPIGLPGWTMQVEVDGQALHAGNSGGLHRYTGSGSWTLVSSPMNGRTVRAILSLPGLMLIGADNGIARSVAGGPFALANAGLANTDILRLDAAGSSIYATTAGGVHVSTDGGASWTPRTANWGDAIAADPGDPSFVVHWYYAGLSRSTDAGIGWDPDVRTPDMARARVHDVAFDPAGSGRSIYATGRGLFEAVDHALAFRALGALDAWHVRRMTTGPGDTRLFSSPAGTLRQVAAGPFELIDVGGPNFATTLGVSVLGDTYYSVGRNIARSGDGRVYQDVFQPTAADGFSVIDIVQLDGRAFATTQTRALAASDGTAFTPTPLGVSYTEAVIALPGTPPLVAIASNQGVRLSTDGGVTFQGAGPTPNDDILALLALPDGTLLAGGDGGLYARSPAGGTFVPRALAGRQVRALALHDGRVVATADDEIVISGDGGMTFAPLPFQGKRPIAFHVEPAGTLLVGTSGWGVYRLPPPP